MANTGGHGVRLHWHRFRKPKIACVYRSMAAFLNQTTTIIAMPPVFCMSRFTCEVAELQAAMVTIFSVPRVPYNMPRPNKNRQSQLN